MYLSGKGCTTSGLPRICTLFLLSLRCNVNVIYNASVYRVIGVVHAGAFCHLHSRRFTGGYAGSCDSIWWGVVVPAIEASKVRKSLVERGYGVLGSRSVIDETAEAYEEPVEAIIESAEVETKMKRLLDEIDRTKRRVNALEFKVIPELKEGAAFTKMRLDEMERDELSRLKRIKAKSAE